MKIKFYVLFLVIFILPINLFANNIQVANVRLENKNTAADYVSIVFDLSWENSWRVSSAPSNWDAAWVFIKFRQNGGAWQHATLSSSDTNHDAPIGCNIDAVSDGMGVFVYRSSNGSGTNNWLNIGLRWLYGSNGVDDDATDVEIKVFAIEMVYVPQGSFYVGDGSSIGRLWDANDINTNPALISSTSITVKCEDPRPTDPPMDEQLEGDGILIDGDAGIDVDGTTTIDNPNFPTGYNAFYCMKYEISNQQFVGFLNTLSREEQDSQVYTDLSGDVINMLFPITYTDTVHYRNTIRFEYVSMEIIHPEPNFVAIYHVANTDQPLHFFCDLNENGIENDADDGKNLALCHVGWANGTAYSDWAGLRPMTELEYEKSCRGPEISIAGEYAWHSTDIYYTELTMVNLGQEDSHPSNPSTGLDGNMQWRFTTGHETDIDSPLRVGMFATSSTNRINAGASYYGIMELSGSLTERVVSLGDIKGRRFQGTHGDGQLSITTGNATNTDWPGIVTGEEADGVKTWTGSGLRGGDWNDGVNLTAVSNRSISAYDPYDTFNIGRGNIGSGYRAVRTAE